MINRSTLIIIASLAASLAAAPAAAVVKVINLDFSSSGPAFNTTSASRTNNGVTGVATALRFTVAPGLLASLGQTSAAGQIRQTAPGIGINGGASNDQLDTNQSTMREAILLSTSHVMRLAALKLSFIDADDTLAIYGVNADDSLSYLGFDGEIRTGLAGGGINVTNAGANNGTTSFTFASPTARFDRFVITTRVGGDISYLGTLGQGFRVDRITGLVPEPGTWAMLVLGFGMVGVAARRRHGASVVA